MGQTVHRTSFLNNHNLGKAYYEELSRKAEERQVKRKEEKAKLTAEEALHAEIAQDLRRLPKSAVMSKWKISYTLCDKIQGNMLLGKY